MKKIFTVFLLLLAGCSNQPPHPTVQYYVQNPQQLEDAIQQCKNADSNSANTADCMIIAQAAQKVRQLAVELATNQEAFGARILATQMKLAALQLQLQQAQENRNNVDVQQLSKGIANIQSELNARLAVIRLLTQPSG